MITSKPYVNNADFDALVGAVHPAYFGHLSPIGTVGRDGRTGDRRLGLVRDVVNRRRRH
ncbi:MAG: hypothetical protein OXF79_16700 [Chloroflexi bacterium]|nr:hypothetical protein [Chloroflexota bacterium]